jgi:hypothetical protein
MPELEFALDTSLDQAQRLEEIITAIEAGESEVPDHSLPETVPVATDRLARNRSAERMNQDHQKRESERRSRAARGSNRKRNRR